jgi:NitT/TauT family transport system substrate-binding protein
MADSRSLTVLAPVPYVPAGYATILLAEALGYAEEDGLDVRVVAAGSPTEAVAGVVGGRGDVTFVNAAFGFIVRDRGDPFRMFYSFARHANRSFAVPADSPIRAVAELRGTTIGLHFPDLLYLARAALVDEGVDPDREVRFVPLPGSPVDAEKMTAAVRAGEVQAVWQLDLNYGLFEAEGLPLRQLPSRTIDRLTPSACLYATDATLATREDNLAVLGRAVARATVFARTNPEAAVRLLWQHVPEARPAPGQERRVLRRDLASLKVRLDKQRIEDCKVPRWGAITAEEVAAWQEFMLETRAIGRRRDPGDYFTDELVDRFNAFDPEPVIAQARGAEGVTQAGRPA